MFFVRRAPSKSFRSVTPRPPQLTESALSLCTQISDQSSTHGSSMSARASSPRRKWRSGTTDNGEAAPAPHRSSLHASSGVFRACAQGVAAAPAGSAGEPPARCASLRASVAKANSGPFRSYYVVLWCAQGLCRLRAADRTRDRTSTGPRHVGLGSGNLVCAEIAVALGRSALGRGACDADGRRDAEVTLTVRAPAGALGRAARQSSSASTHARMVRAVAHAHPAVAVFLCAKCGYC